MLFLLAAFLIGLTPVQAQRTYHGCPPEGNAKQTRAKELNAKKNRADDADTTAINPKITFHAMMVADATPTTFREGDVGRITAYCEEVKIGAIETCNCKDTDHWYRDTHIELVLDPMDSLDKTKILVVEVTPRFREKMRKRGIDWSHRALRDAFLGRWVTVTGYAFFDAMHEDESAQSGNAHVWRGTAWELHPVTDIRVTKRPPATTSTPHSTTTPTPQTTEARQCKATTASGKRCSRRTTDPSGYCFQHQR
ncbi:MAG: hypothetical protein JSS89_04475 [Bacteroidetes bacterium]|nr:hypothetical protein [Bacteroidota bacterium]